MHAIWNVVLAEAESGILIAAISFLFLTLSTLVAGVLTWLTKRQNKLESKIDDRHDEGVARESEMVTALTKVAGALERMEPLLRRFSELDDDSTGR